MKSHIYICRGVHRLALLRDSVHDNNAETKWKVFVDAFWLVVLMFYCFVGWLFGRLVGWLVGWLVVWLVGWLVL